MSVVICKGNVVVIDDGGPSCHCYYIIYYLEVIHPSIILKYSQEHNFRYINCMWRHIFFNEHEFSLPSFVKFMIKVEPLLLCNIINGDVHVTCYDAHGFISSCLRKCLRIVLVRYHLYMFQHNNMTTWWIKKKKRIYLIWDIYPNIN